VATTVQELQVEQVRGAQKKLAGVGALLPSLAAQYDWLERQGLDPAVPGETTPLGTRFVYKGQALLALRAGLFTMPWDTLCQRAGQAARQEAVQ
jgi:hypothetical protein